MVAKLDGKVALITGATRGIGREIAVCLAQKGASVIITGRNTQLLDGVLQELLRHSSECVSIPSDMSCEESLKALISEVQSRYGRLDILINNAGVTHSSLLKDTRTQDWDYCMQINARGPFILCREAIPMLLQSARGFIINIGSVVSVKGYPNQSAYTASKHALRGMTISLAEELRGSSVTVHMICPGAVDTEMVSSVRPDINKEELIQPAEIAELVKYIVTKKGKGIVDEFHLRRETSSPWF